MKNQGISLISLIITIIVIIILAAIVIFSGLNAPDSAQFANFTSQVDNVNSAMLNAFGDLKVKHAVSGDTRTNEQIYLEIATASDPEQYNVMNKVGATSDGSKTAGMSTTGAGFVNIGPEKTANKLDMKLPNVRQSNKAWYVTKDGRVFNANGYVYDNKTYFTASVYTEGELKATDTNQVERAEKIYNLISGDADILKITLEVTD